MIKWRTLLNKFTFNYHKRPYHNLYILGFGVCCLLDGLIMLLTFGFVVSELQFRYVATMTKRYLELQIEDRKMYGVAPEI